MNNNFLLYKIIQKYKLMAQTDERYVFIVEWFDTSASLIRTYNFTYFMSDKTIEMVLLFNIQFDLKNKRVFLKRCEYPSI